MISGKLIKGWSIALTFAIYHAVSYAGDAITATNAWVREAPPHADVSAGYLVLHNQTAQAHKLVGASSPQFKKTEIHEMKMNNGQANMHRVDELSIGPNGSVELKPGGYHLMLINPVRPLKAGDTVELKLQFNDAPAITLQATVRKGDEEEHMHHHDMNM